MKPYKTHFGWTYPELPDTVRPATHNDLFMPSGKPNYGKQFLYYSHISKAYLTEKIRQSTTADELNIMLKDKVIYIKK
jgi:hypothetical protein